MTTKLTAVSAPSTVPGQEYTVARFRRAHPYWVASAVTNELLQMVRHVMLHRDSLPEVANASGHPLFILYASACLRLPPQVCWSTPPLRLEQTRRPLTGTCAHAKLNCNKGAPRRPSRNLFLPQKPGEPRSRFTGHFIHAILNRNNPAPGTPRRNPSQQQDEPDMKHTWAFYLYQ